MNKGFILPNMNIPVAELILTYYNKSNTLTNISTVLICVPIYNTGNPINHEYIVQLIDSTLKICDYENKIGMNYDGEEYKKSSNTNLSTCIQSCCNDTNCLAYTFNKGNCSLKKSVTTYISTGDDSYHTGKVDKSKPSTCSKITNDTNKVYTLESIFNTDPIQTSFGYISCYDLINENKDITSQSMAIFVFPNGIHLQPKQYEQIVLQLNGNLSLYSLPSTIRDGKKSIHTYNIINNVKNPTSISSEGYIPIVSISSSSHDFNKKIDYFIKGPIFPKTSKQSKNDLNISQYKCVPFKSLQKGDGQVPVTLDMIYNKQNEIITKQQDFTFDISPLVYEILLGICGCIIVIGVLLFITFSSDTSNVSSNISSIVPALILSTK